MFLCKRPRSQKLNQQPLLIVKLVATFSSSAARTRIATARLEQLRQHASRNVSIKARIRVSVKDSKKIKSPGRLVSMKIEVSDHLMHYDV